MRLSLMLFFLSTAMAFSAESYSQSTKITLNLSNVTVKEVIKAIEDQSEFIFFYQDQQIDLNRRVTMEVNGNNIREVLNELFEGTSNTYKINDRQIIIGQLKNENSLPGNKTDQPTEQLPKKKVSGVVKDAKGQPIAGVTIVVKGTTIGTITDAEGKYEINIPADAAVLAASFIGMKSVEESLNESNVYDFRLVETAELIEDVVVTGYQSVAKARSTGATSKVMDAIIAKRPNANLANSLVGQVAGMVADPSTGFVIRGQSSLSGAGDRVPLLVVDGFPIEGGFSSINPNDVKSVDVLKDASATSIYGARAANGVIVITSRDAGPKGRMNVSYNNFFSFGEQIDLGNYMNIADGKTQIAYEDKYWQTFKGTSMLGDPYTSSTGSFRGARSPYSTLMWELTKGNITKEYFDKQRQAMLSNNYQDDVYKYLLRNSFSMEHNLQISGTSDKNSYKFTVLYDNDQTSYQYNNSNKLMLNFTNIYSITDKIKYQFVANYTAANGKYNGISLSQVKSVTSPWTRIFDEEGNYARMHYQNYEPLVKTYEPRMPYSMRYNILEESRMKDNTSESADFRIQNQVEFKLAEGIKFVPMYQYEQYSYSSRSIYAENMYASRNYANLLSALDPLTNNYTSLIPKGGIYRSNGDTKRSSHKFRAQLDFARTFNGKHNVVALIGGEVISTVTDVEAPTLNFGYNPAGLNFAMFDYKSSYNDMFGNVVNDNSISYEGDLIYNYKASNFRQAYRYNARYLAAYLNGSYTYDNRFTGTLSMRTDASNYVAKTVRDKFSPFYSIGGLWNMKNEQFMKGADFMDRLALRASYGVTGLAAGKNSVTAVTVFSSQGSTPETGNLPNGYLTGRDNDFLTWEKTYSTDIGVDFSMFKRKLWGTVDVYNRHTRDVLSSVQTSQVVQSTSVLNMNLWELLNRGIEVSLGTSLNITRELNWEANVNFDYNINEVLSFNYLNPTLFNYLGSNKYAYVEGRPTDYLYMVKLVGTTKDGYYVQEKKNGELVVANNTSNSFANVGRSTTPGMSVDDDDRVYYMGRTKPPTTLGFNSTFSYKGFTLMTVITGRFGHVFTKNEVLLNGVNNPNYSATGISVLQQPSLTATTSVGNIFPTILNQTMMGESNSLRNYYSNAVVADASHIRFNEIYLGYQFPDQVLGRAAKYFRSVNVFTQARNLGLIWKANKDGLDPEYQPGSLKPISIYTIGLKLNM